MYVGVCTVLYAWSMVHTGTQACVGYKKPIVARVILVDNKARKTKASRSTSIYVPFYLYSIQYYHTVLYSKVSKFEEQKAGPCSVSGMVQYHWTAHSKSDRDFLEGERRGEEESSSCELVAVVSCPVSRHVLLQLLYSFFGPFLAACVPRMLVWSVDCLRVLVACWCNFWFRLGQELNYCARYRTISASVTRRLHTYSTYHMHKILYSCPFCSHRPAGLYHTTHHPSRTTVKM